MPRRRRQAYRTTVPLSFGFSVVFVLRLLVVGVEEVVFLLWISVSVGRLLLVGVRCMASAEQCVDIWF